MNEYGGVSSQVGIPQIMVFRPTMEEFKDFNKYITYMESCGAHRAGLAKVIPPSEWKPVSQEYEKFDDMIIPAPISQMVSGKGGIYTQFNIQKKPMTVREFKKLAHSEKHRTPHFSDYDDLERKYWANILYNQAIYGADISGSLYDPHVSEWNINRLGTILDDIRRDSSIRIEGVNTAYLYFGMWKTSFAWHTEDIDLYSINYLHFGAPKSWYSIPPQFGRRLERLASNYFAATARNCRAFLRHKMTLISPLILKKYSIPFNKVTQEPGEFMITFPYGYHQGYNHGYNCAESTNFASIRWVEYGKRASLCTCSPDMVRIGMDPFVEKYQPERWQLWRAGLDLGPHPEDGPAYKVYADHVMNEILPKWLAARGKNQLTENSTPPPATLQNPPPVHQNNEADKKPPAKIYKSKRVPTYRKSARSPRSQNGDDDVDRKWGCKPVKRARKDTIFASPRLIAGQRQDRTFALTRGAGAGVGGEEESEWPPFLGGGHYVSSSILRPPRLLIPGAGGTSSKGPVNTVQPEVGADGDVGDKSNMTAADGGPAVRHICFPENFERPIPTTTPSSNLPAAPSPLLKVIDFDRVSSMEITPPDPSASGSSVKLPGDNVSTKCKAPKRATDLNLFAQTMTRHPIIRAKYFSPATPHFDTPDAQSLRKYNFEFGWGEAWCAICQILKPRTLKNINQQPTNSTSPNTHVNHLETCSPQSPSTPKVEALEDEVVVLGETRSSDLKFLLPVNGQKSLSLSLKMAAAPVSCDILMPEICFVVKKAPTTPAGSAEGGELLLPEVGGAKGDNHVTGCVGGGTPQAPSSDGQLLLTCSSCKVRIHAACYGVGDPSEGGEDWMCDPCEGHALASALCLLCGCRGGALKATSDRSSWCHVTCALATPGVHFGDLAARDLVTVSLGAQDEGNHPCHYCRYVTTMTSSAPGPAEEGLTVGCCRCPLRFHVTCGWGAGALFEIRDWPHPPLGIACHAHSSPHDHVETNVHVAGDMVYAKHKNARYYRAKVVDRQKEEYYKFEFEDGTFCDNGLPQDIEDYDCILNGPPAIGAKVMVRWTDGLVYSANFRGSNTNTFYMVEFEDGSQCILKGQFLYGLDEDIPEKIRNKISEASVPRKYNSFFDQTLSGPNQKKKR